MKNSLIALSAAVVVLMGPSLSVARASDKVGPCKEIKAACEAAGYVKGAHKTTGKGLAIDCMRKLKNGETVEGVTVTPEQVNACKAHMEKGHAKKAAKAAAATGAK